MTIQEEIKYRETIMQKAYNRQKLTTEERIWLITHPLYHSKLGAPYLLKDIIKVQPNTLYAVQIKQESVLCANMPVPIIGIPPHKKGFIRINSLEKPVKILGLLFDKLDEPIEVQLKTPEGFISVEYEYTYFDELQNITVRQASSNLSFAMKKEYVSDNKVAYHCKLPNNPDFKNFEDYVFSVKWKPCNQSGDGSVSSSE